MFRQTVLQQHRTILTRAVLSRSSQPSVSLTNYRYKHSVVDSAKETLSSLNKKIGEFAASGLEKAEDATESVKETDLTGKAKSKLDAVNKKVGKAAASGIEKAEDATESLKDTDLTGKAKSGLDAVNKKVGKAAAAGIETAETVAKSSDPTGKAKSAADSIGDKASEASESAAKTAKGAWDDTKAAANDKFQEKVEGQEKVADKAKDTYNKAKQVTSDTLTGENDLKHFGSSTLTEEDLLSDDPVSEGSHHIKENIKGYKSLQDKGKKAYSEQNRPEDFM